MILAEYIWIDGVAPTKGLRSKTKVIKDARLKKSTEYASLDDIPMEVFEDWTADGSSTNQAEGRASDILIRPVRAIADPFRVGHYLVLCEVFTGAGELHPTNTRAELRRVLDAGAAVEEPMFGFEQEYTLMLENGKPYGFPENGFPAAQGPYYCAVGTGKIHGRAFYEKVIEMTLAAGLKVTGYNWEVMPGQAELQIFSDALEASDHIWLARYIMHRVSEDYGVVVSIDAKPQKGDWNGAGMHSNFSTKSMRAPGGIKAIEEACVALSKQIQAHLDVYGHDYQSRLTGAHETCSYRDFKWGVSDRTASIRIPRQVGKDGCGYLEDRRPNANADPYEVSSRMLKTVLNFA
jgi:glutamine synthetase